MPRRLALVVGLFLASLFNIPIVAAAAPFNDNRANAWEIDRLSWGVGGTVKDATVEEGEPTACPEASGELKNTVWYRFEAYASLDLLIHVHYPDGWVPHVAFYDLDETGGQVLRSCTRDGASDSVLAGKTYFFAVGALELPPGQGSFALLVEARRTLIAEATALSGDVFVDCASRLGGACFTPLANESVFTVDAAPAIDSGVCLIGSCSVPFNVWGSTRAGSQLLMPPPGEALCSGYDLLWSTLADYPVIVVALATAQGVPGCTSAPVGPASITVSMFTVPDYFHSVFWTY
jgi:hypothetical protein